MPLFESLEKRSAWCGLIATLNGAVSDSESKGGRDALMKRYGLKTASVQALLPQLCDLWMHAQYHV